MKPKPKAPGIPGGPREDRYLKLGGPDPLLEDGIGGTWDA